MSESARNLVAAILRNEEMVNTLVSACTAQSGAVSRTQYRTTDEEMYSLFHRGRPNTVGLTSQAAHGHLAGSTSSEGNVPPTPQEPPVSTPVYNLRPFTRKGPRQKRFHADSHSVAQLFTKEVILLPDHTYTHVPRRATKAWLFENGHIKSALELSCTWDSIKVMQAITEAFQPIVGSCRLQILLPCHNKLVVPSLSPKQSLTGALVKKLFHQKSIYVRPDKVLITEEKELSIPDGDSQQTNSSEPQEASDDINDATQSLSSGDQIIWCAANQAVFTDEPSSSKDNNTMSSCAAIITIDSIHTLPSQASVISSGNTDVFPIISSAICSNPTNGLSCGTNLNSNDDPHNHSATPTSAVSSDHTPPISGAISSTASSASSYNLTRTPYSTYQDLFEEEYLSDDPDLQEAISRSLTARTNESDSVISLEGIMEQITSRINNDDTVRFNIIRRNVWDGASRAMCRSNFAPEKKMDIKFTDDYGISEGAVDNGGPTREFFRLCLHEIKDNIGIFEGPPNARVLTCNSRAMKDNGYFRAGQIMAMSLAHGGQSPCFLSDVLYECLQKGPDNVKAKIEHISDDETRSQVQSILEAETDSQLEDAVARAANLISLAGHNVHVTLKTKEETAMDLAHWYVLQRTRAPFERFCDGLKALGVLDALQRYPLQMMCLFMKPEKALTAADLESLFQIIHSERGSNRFQQECHTLAFWQDYLQDAEFEKDVSLEEILVFFTGCDRIPALGFSPKPSLEFITYSRFPVANTCENILRIPIHVEYANFKSDMDFAIRNSPGFGRA